MAKMLCTESSGSGEKRFGNGNFKVKTVCPVCKGECYLPEDKPDSAEKQLGLFDVNK